MTRWITISVCLALIMGLVAGCEGPYRKAALQAMDKANATDNTVVQDLWRVGMTGQLGLAKARVRAAKTPEEIDKILNDFANVASDTTWLYRQHERANGLRSHGRIYIEQTQSWLELAGTKLDEAKKEREQMLKAPTSAPVSSP